MKNLVITAILSIIFLGQAQAQPTFGLEFMWGLGASSKKTEGTESRYCKNRPWGGMKGFGLYISDDNLEAHVSKYSHDADADNCNRSNWAIGLGPVLSSRDEDKASDYYADWSPGILFRFNETWRDHGKWSFYNRFRLGAPVDKDSDYQTNVELGLLQYGGFFEKNHGEKFLTFGISRHEIKDNYNGNNSNNSANSNSSNGSTDGSSNEGEGQGSEGDGNTGEGNDGTEGNDGNSSTNTTSSSVTNIDNSVTNITNITNVDNSVTNIDNSVTNIDNSNTEILSPPTDTNIDIDININTGNTGDGGGGTPPGSGGDLDKGNGNDPDGVDEDNPGKGKNK